MFEQISFCYGIDFFVIIDDWMLRSIKLYFFVWFLNVVREFKNLFILFCSYIFRIVVDVDICVFRLCGVMCVFFLEVVIFG